MLSNMLPWCHTVIGRLQGVIPEVSAGCRMISGDDSVWQDLEHGRGITEGERLRGN